MRPEQRIVTKLPLSELWDEKGKIEGERIRYLDRSDLVELLRSCLVQFIVANCGFKLEWIPSEKRFEFWKRVRRQISNPLVPIRLGEFPEEVAYTASEWRGRASECLILLEKHH